MGRIPAPWTVLRRLKGRSHTQAAKLLGFSDGGGRFVILFKVNRSANNLEAKLITLLKPLSHTPRGGEGWAGVAAIIETNNQSLLVVRRSVMLGDPWSGQWALPGGRWGECDDDLFQTVRREVIEETGIDIARLRSVGWLSERVPRIRPNMRVVPLVVLCEGIMEVKLSEELDDYRWVPLNGLRRVKQQMDTIIGPSIVDAYVFEDVLIWGLTASILGELLELLA